MGANHICPQNSLGTVFKPDITPAPATQHAIRNGLITDKQGHKRQRRELIRLSFTDYKFCQGHGIFRIHPPHRGTAVSGRKHLARTGDKKFAGLDKFPLLLPPSADLIAHITGHAPGDGKPQFSRNFGCFLL